MLTVQETHLSLFFFPISWRDPRPDDQPPLAAAVRRPACGPGGPLRVRPASQQPAIRHLDRRAGLGGLQPWPPLLGGRHCQQRLLARWNDHRRVQAQRPLPHDPEAGLLGAVAQHKSLLCLHQAGVTPARRHRAQTYGDLLRLRRGPDLLLQRRNKVAHLHLHRNLQREAVPSVRPAGWPHAHEDLATTQRLCELRPLRTPLTGHLEEFTLRNKFVQRFLVECWGGHQLDCRLIEKHQLWLSEPPN